jgi:hypothetical protein
MRAARLGAGTPGMMGMIEQGLSLYLRLVSVSDQGRAALL